MNSSDYDLWEKYFEKIGSWLPNVNNPSGTVTILPMAGKGSRFFSKGYETPKPLIDVNGKPMVVEATSCIPKSDGHVFICQKDHMQNQKLKDALMSFKDTKIVEIDHVTKGQACTCEIGINTTKIDENTPIQISACDNGVLYDTNSYERLVNDPSVDIIVWSFRNHSTSKNNPDMYAWLDVDSDGLVKYVSCKKFIYDDPSTTHAIIGTMFFRKSKYFIDGLRENYRQNITTNGEFYVDDVLNRCIEKGLKVHVFEANNYICWGTPEDYEEYNRWKGFFSKKSNFNS